MTFAPITFDYVGAAVRPLNDRLHELVGKELDGTATADEIVELDGLCAALEAAEGVRPASVPVIPEDHLLLLMEGKRADQSERANSLWAECGR